MAIFKERRTKDNQLVSEFEQAGAGIGGDDARGIDKERRMKENQLVSELEQEGAGTSGDDARETTRVKGRARWADGGE